MTAKRKIQICIDTAMIIILPVLMAYMLIGEAAHEWLGISMFVLFIAHHVLNANWHKNLFKGRYMPIRIFSTVIDSLLFAAMIMLMVSALLLSRHVFAFLNINIGLDFARNAHMLGAYWGFILMSLHVGQHGKVLVGIIEQSSGRRLSAVFRTVMRIAAALISAYGIYAFYVRQIWSYMFLRTYFVFFDFDEPLVFFFLDYISVMILFASAGYYLSKLISGSRMWTRSN